jgi:hypothetical protein
MAASNRRRRARAATAPVNPLRGRPVGRQPATGGTVTNRAQAYPAFVAACNSVIDTMIQYGMSGREKAAHLFTEIGQGLLSPATFSGSGGRVATSPLTVRTTPVGTLPAPQRTTTASSSTTRRRRARGGTTTSITAQQQQILNNMTIGAEYSGAQVAQMLGISPTTAGRSLGSLKNKNLVQGRGRGANAIYWKAAQQQQAVA